jgi:hypothetical protein
MRSGETRVRTYIGCERGEVWEPVIDRAVCIRGFVLTWRDAPVP